MANSAKARLPERRRRYTFALTPLADAMFQLLIFFMLSSSLTPYSLLPLQASPGAEDSAAIASDQVSDAAAEEAPLPGDVALWTLDKDTVIVSGQRFALDALEDLTRALTADAGSDARVIVIVRQAARVQDVTTVLAGLRAAKVSSVQVTTEAF